MSYSQAIAPPPSRRRRTTPRSKTSMRSSARSSPASRSWRAGQPSGSACGRRLERPKKLLSGSPTSRRSDASGSWGGSGTMRTTWRFDRRRRKLLRNAGAAAATAALGPLIIIERTIAQTRTLYVNSWGGSFTAAQDVAYFKPFTALTGIQIRTVTPVSYAKIKAQVTTGRYEFDMTSINSMQWLRASREGLADLIDWTIVDKSTLRPEAVVANGHGIASNIQGTNLCYRSDKFPNGGPKSWADFWDVKAFPG